MSSQNKATYPNCSYISRVVSLEGYSKPRLLEMLHEQSISINPLGQKIFSEVPFSASRHALKTVQLMVRDLGLPTGGTSKQIFEKAEELGLGLCPIEVGPYLRLQYLDQPAGFWIIIASQKPFESDEDPNGFYLRRLDDGLWLRGYFAAPEYMWDPNDHFVFAEADGSQG